MTFKFFTSSLTTKETENLIPYPTESYILSYGDNLICLEIQWLETNKPIVILTQTAGEKKELEVVSCEKSQDNWTIDFSPFELDPDVINPLTYSQIAKDSELQFSFLRQDSKKDNLSLATTEQIKEKEHLLQMKGHKSNKKVNEFYQNLEEHFQVFKISSKETEADEGDPEAEALFRKALQELNFSKICELLPKLQKFKEEATKQICSRILFRIMHKRKDDLKASRDQIDNDFLSLYPQLIKLDLDVNYRDDDIHVNQTLLIAAILNEYTELTEKLLNNSKVDFDAKDGFGGTALHAVIRYAGCFLMPDFKYPQKLFQALLEKVEDLEPLNLDRQTPVDLIDNYRDLQEVKPIFTLMVHIAQAKRFLKQREKEATQPISISVVQTPAVNVDFNKHEIIWAVTEYIKLLESELDARQHEKPLPTIQNQPEKLKQILNDSEVKSLLLNAEKMLDKSSIVHELLIQQNQRFVLYK